MNTDWEWLKALQTCHAGQKPCVLVTVSGTKGSTPRSAGAKMLVEAQKISGTIGGGNLELQATEKARALIASAGNRSEFWEVLLGAHFGQCCGGSVQLYFEPFFTNPTKLYIYGNGHIARALVPLLAEFSLQIIWIDEREQDFPIAVPSNVSKLNAFDLSQITPADLVVIMTHRHDLDFEIVHGLLQQNPPQFLGLIGSKKKRDSFEQRLSKRGIPPALIKRVVCPIGAPQISLKSPEALAIVIASQILTFIPA